MSDELQGQDGQEQGGMTAEQGADFAAIMNAAGQPEQQQQAQQQEQQAQSLEQAIAETSQMLEVAWDLVGGLLPPKVAERYGPEQRARIAQSGTMLAIKRGWSAAAFMEKWGVEVMFASALVGPSIPVIIDWLKKPKTSTKPGEVVTQAQAVEVPQKAQPDEVPGARTVSFGTVQA